MENEMVERVALALYSAEHPGKRPMPYSLAKRRDLARAAIEALKPEFELCYAKGLKDGSADALAVESIFASGRRGGIYG